MATLPAVPTRSEIIQTLQQQSRRTGVDFDYLLTTAKRESNLKPQAKARTSSAAGMFQFIEQTWLSMVKKHGSKAGLGSMAQAVQTNAKGRHFVTDGKLRQEILALRHDVGVSSFMAGMLSKDSQVQLETSLGRKVNPGELYIAHFLGARGASKFIKAAEADPTQSAAQHFPRAAKANRPIFYEKGGAPRTLGEVYMQLTKQHTPSAAKSPMMAARPTPQQGQMVEVMLPSFSRSAPLTSALRASESLPAMAPPSLLSLSPILLDILTAMGEGGKRAANIKNGS